MTFFISFCSEKFKFDANVFQIRANARFWPGHNKWDYDYSIRRLRPDIVVDEFLETRAYMRRLATRYDRLENGMYVATDTPLVDKGLLLAPTHP